MVGKSKALKRLKEEAKEAAKNDRTVLILGEPGTEKRDVAGLIHWGSSRKEGPLLSVDIKTVSIGRCVGLPEKHDSISGPDNPNIS